MRVIVTCLADKSAIERHAYLTETQLNDKEARMSERSRCVRHACMKHVCTNEQGGRDECRSPNICEGDLGRGP